MKLCLVSIESGIITVGFRKIASLVRSLFPDSDICYIVPANHMSFGSFLFGGQPALFSERDMNAIVSRLACSDIVGFSSMTSFAGLTKELISRLRTANPDDSFIGLPVPVLKDFAERWKRELDISFSVVGALPSLVNREKVEILLDAGMRRIKMGIQTGSDRILKFYKRPATASVTLRAVTIISEFTDYMIPPTYDIILDNPVETREDVTDSLKFVYHMPRPFNLNIFSLRLMPNTELAVRLKEMDIHHPTITEKSYTEVKPSVANILMFALDIVKPPERIFEYFLKQAKPYCEPQKEYPVVLMLVRTVYLIKRGFHHIRFLDFSYFPGMVGKIGYFLQRTGILRRHHQWLLRRFSKRPNKPVLNCSNGAD